MSVIESIRNRKGLSTWLAAGMIVLAGLIMIWNTRSNIPSDATKAFYTVDDGDTYFIDDLNKAYPFDHDGKQAYRAYVFKSKSSGKKFVAFIERMNDIGRARMEELLTQPREKAKTQIAHLLANCTEVKRPHGTEWAAVNTPAYGMIMNPTGPDGSKDVQCITP
jgi:hypothetical protein